MKKIFTVLLAVAIVFSMTTGICAEELENYAKDAVWEQGYVSSVSVDGDGVATATGISGAWSSPTIDILPAIKEALGTDDEIEITISFQARATFTKGNEDESFTARALIRGANGIPSIKTSDVEAWTSAYEDSLTEADPLFSNSNGNLLKYLDQNIDLSSEWTYFSTTLELYGEQITNPSVSKWNFCVDKIPDATIVETLQFKDFAVTVGEPEEPEEEEEEEETPVENETVTETDAPVATVAPTEKPTEAPAAATEAPQDNANDNGNVGGVNPIVIASIVSAVIIIGTAVGAFIVVKKKTSDK